MMLLLFNGRNSSYKSTLNGNNFQQIKGCSVSKACEDKEFALMVCTIVDLGYLEQLFFPMV